MIDPLLPVEYSIMSEGGGSSEVDSNAVHAS